MLHLGDSFPNVVLEQWDLLYPGRSRSVLDLVKVSHHGSRNNTSPALVERIAGRNYIISTDGSKHAHPNIESLLWIADQCEEGSLLLFNYPSESATRMDRPKAKERFGHRVNIGNGRAPMLLAFPGEGDREASNG